MRILALEFSSAQRSVAVCQETSGAQRSARPTTLVNEQAALSGLPDGLQHQGRARSPLRAAAPCVESGLRRATECAPYHQSVAHAAAAGGRSTRAFALIQAALQQAQCEREDIECLAVGLGPGSYTGIRVAIAIAQGWQLARAVKLLGLSSAECLAARLQAEGRAGRYAIAIDAQRNEFYVATGEVTPAGWRETEPLRLVPFTELQRRADAGEQLVGPELTQWFASARELFPDAATLGRLAAERSDFVAGEQLAPIYLRPTAFVKAPPPRFA